MRVGQLARKLAISPSEIIDFLNQKEIHLEEGSNAKLNSDLEREIVGHFAPALLASFEAEKVSLDDPESAFDKSSMEELQEPLPENTMAEHSVTIEPPAIQEVVQSETSFSETDESEFEVIKAPKQELPGLKVVGKINLPEPKKKEEEFSPEETVEATSELDNTTSKVAGGEVEKDKRKERSKERERFNTRRERREYPQKNSVIVQRERDAREAEKRKKREEKLDKEKRTQNYLKKVNAYSPTKSFRLYREEEEHKPEQVKPIKRSPARKKTKTTVWGKFVNWLKRE